MESTNHSTTRQFSWISLAPQLTLMALLILLFHVAGTKQAVMFGALTYIALSRGLKLLLLKYHNRGIAFVCQGNYEEALECFQRSANYFNENQWMDKYRSFVLLSGSQLTYREMALVNIAFSHYHLNRKTNARACYNRVLEEYPNNKQAKEALDILDAEEGQ